MSRPKGKENSCYPRKKFGWHDEVYWGSASYNARLYNAYLGQVMAMAVTRFEWRGLPATIDALWLERTLLIKGVATIARPIDANGNVGPWIAAKMATDGVLNIYDRPTRWFAYSRDMVRFACTPRNGVVLYDNVNGRYNPTIDAIDLAVRELVDIQKTKQMNRFHQKVPYVLVTPPDMELSAVNLLSQIMGGEPGTIANPAIRDLDLHKVGFDVPYLGAELTAAEQNVWNRIYTMLGISNVTFKSERMIEDEVRSMSEPATMMGLSGLAERRRAATMLNDVFGMNVSVIWRQDNESDNANALGNIERASKIIAGETKGIGEVLSNEPQ